MDASPLTVAKPDPGVVPVPVKVAAAAYVAATLLGVVMRLELVGIPSGVPFDHLLHAHSHTLYFGWGAVGLWGVVVGGAGTAGPGWLRLAVGGALGVVPALLLGFLASGYHPVTIAISTVAMLSWYALAVGWWRRPDTAAGVAGLAQRTGIVYLAVASLGVWMLAAVQAAGGSEFAETLAIHAFLLGFGWFLVFVLVGALLQHPDRWSFEEETVRRVLRWWSVLAWVTFPLGVAGGPEVWGLGPLARVAGVALVVPGLWWLRALWGAASGPDRVLFRISAAWFGLTTITTAAVGLAGTSAIEAGGRQGVVLHLHALFVGFLTPLLVLLVCRHAVRTSLLVHHAGLAAMLAGVVAIAAGGPGPGAWLALAGGAVVWAAGIRWALPLWGGRP